jgi:hypothetical protein
MSHAPGRTIITLKHKDNNTISEKKTLDLKIISRADWPLREGRAMVKPGFIL